MNNELDGLDGFEQRELLGDAYWNDPRWLEVDELRKQNKNLEANGLVSDIRYSWGIR